MPDRTLQKASARKRLVALVAELSEVAPIAGADLCLSVEFDPAVTGPEHRKLKSLLKKLIRDPNVSKLTVTGKGRDLEQVRVRK